MGARPQTLCYLTPGRLIDAHPGFVATWNWLVDFVANLRGDADTVEHGALSLDTTDTAHPVLTMTGDLSGAGAVADSQYVVSDVSFTDGDDPLYPYSIKIEYGKLVLNSDKEIEIEAVPYKTRYIETVPHVKIMDDPAGGTQ